MTYRLLSVLVLMLLAATAQAKPKWQELPLPPAMPESTSHGLVDVGGAKIYYAIYGKGEPVILLHGGLGNSDHFANQVPPLAENYQVIVIDSRGQGRSTLTKAKITYHTMSADVLAVMDKLELKSAAFVGWSDGGEIALDIAIRHPERVTKMFIFGANYDSKGSKPRSGPPAPTFNAYAAKCRADYQKMSATPRRYDALVDALLPLWRSPMGFTKDQLKSIQAPTLVADGEHDEIIELDQIREMATLIPNGQLLIMPDVSHFAIWQDPAAFTKAILDFLAAPKT